MTMTSWSLLQLGTQQDNADTPISSGVIGFLGYNPYLGYPKTLIEQVLQYRKSVAMIQKELARQIGIDGTTLSRIERSIGRCFPPIL